MTYADLAFLGASVEPIVPRTASARAVAVRDGRITAVGTAQQVRDQIGSGTRVVELDGQTLLPGFQDAHVHPIDGGLLGDLVDLHPLPGVTAYIAAGSIEVGKQADLVALDRDLRAPDAGPIGDAAVRATWVAGEQVFGD